MSSEYLGSLAPPFSKKLLRIPAGRHNEHRRPIDKSFAAKTRFRKKRYAKRRHFFLYEHSERVPDTSHGCEPAVDVTTQSSRLGPQGV